MRWFRCVATSYQWWGVGGEFPHLWRKSVDAAAILRDDFGNVNVIPLHQTCPKKFGRSSQTFLGGCCLFSIWKMMRRSFRMSEKIHPKPFWIPPKKIHLFPPATPINHTAINPSSNPLQPPSGCHHWVPAIASHLPLPKHLSPGPESARNARERTWVRQKGDVKNPPKQGKERGERLMSDEIFWWCFFVISDDFWWFSSWISNSRTIYALLTWISSTKRRVVEEQHSWCGLLRQRRPARFGTDKTWPNSSTTGMTIIYTLPETNIHSTWNTGVGVGSDEFPFGALGLLPGATWMFQEVRINGYNPQPLILTSWNIQVY